MNLDAQGRDFIGNLGAPALDQGRQQVDPALVARPGLQIAVVQGMIEMVHGPQGQCPSPLGKGLHGQQHAAHIRVLDNRHRARVPRCAALTALPGVATGRLAGPFRHRHPLQPHRQPGVVHHREHVAQTLILFSNQVAQGAAVVAIGHGAGGTGVDAELVLHADGKDIIALADSPLGIHQELGHDEQGNALDPRRRVRGASQYEVNDVVGIGLIAPGDEDRLAEQPKVVAIRLGAGGDQPQIGPRLGFGEVHGASPLTTDQAGQIQGLLAFGAIAGKGGDHPLGEHRHQAKGHIGALQNLVHGESEGVGQPLAAKRGIAGQAWPTAGPIGLVEAIEGRGGNYPAILHPGTLPIRGLIARRHPLPVKTSRFIENGRHQLVAKALRAGQRGGAVEFGHMAQHKCQLRDRRPVITHCPPPDELTAASLYPIIA